MKQSKVTVDILMVSYNHEAYIAQAIESVLMQKTEFAYRLIIGEDCSKDKTREIVEAYIRRYPDRVTGILHERNVGMSRNYKALMMAATADYVFILEGDDYWTDEHLIQKHVEYLEGHKETAAILCNSRSVNEKGEPDESLNVFPLFDEYYYGREQACEFYLPGLMGGLCYRNLKYILSENQWKEYDACTYNDDVKLFVTLGVVGGIYCNPAVVVDHRRVINHGTSWSAMTEGKNMSLYEYEGVKSGASYLQNAFGIKINSKKKLNEIKKWVMYSYLYRPTNANKEAYWEFCEKGYLNGAVLACYWIRCQLGYVKRALMKLKK